jgi:uncharacterized membrane protein
MSKSRFQNIPMVDYSLAKKIYYTILWFGFFWVLLIFLAPLFMELGGVFEKISSIIYIFFSKVCHQSDERSFHFLEHRLGVCSRCVWIYTGFFLGTVLYPLKYKLNNTNPPSVWILGTAFLILMSDVIFDISGILNNTFLSRSLTGFVMGFVLPFYIIPGFVKFFYEVHSFLRKKIST